MSKLKKLAAILLSAAIFVCALSISAGADSIEDTAKKISSGQSYSTQLYRWDTADYKIIASNSGTLKINLTSKAYSTRVYIFDSNGNSIPLADNSVSSGYASYYSSSEYTYCEWNNTIEKFAGTLEYSIKKGTYYLRFERSSSDGSGKLTFTATFPSSSSSSSAKLTGIVIPMKLWDTMQLSAAASSKTSGTVTWSSSNPSVASVSSTGKVTAKKKGTAVITAKLGSSSASIVIKVT